MLGGVQPRASAQIWRELSPARSGGQGADARNVRRSKAYRGRNFSTSATTKEPKMNITDQPTFAERDAKSKAVARAVSRLADKPGYDADIVFEGALLGACAALLSRGASNDDVAKLLENSGRFIRTLRPGQRVMTASPCFVLCLQSAGQSDNLHARRCKAGLSEDRSLARQALRGRARQALPLTIFPI